MSLEILPLAGEGIEWAAFVRSPSGGSPFHLLAWKRAVEQSFGHRPHYLMAVGDHGIEGVLPLFEVRGLLGGRGLISVAYAVYGGGGGPRGAGARGAPPPRPRARARRGRRLRGEAPPGRAGRGPFP